MTIIGGRLNQTPIPEWRKQPTPSWEECKEANTWWRALPNEERAHFKEQEGMVSLTEIAKYWMFNIRGKI